MDWEKEFDEELEDNDISLCSESFIIIRTFLRKALQEQERTIRKQMNVVLAEKCDEMDRMAKRLNKKIDEWQDDYIALKKELEIWKLKYRKEYDLRKKQEKL